MPLAKKMLVMRKMCCPFIRKEYAEFVDARQAAEKHIKSCSHQATVCLIRLLRMANLQLVKQEWVQCVSFACFLLIRLCDHCTCAASPEQPFGRLSRPQYHHSSVISSLTITFSPAKPLANIAVGCSGC